MYRFWCLALLLGSLAFPVMSLGGQSAGASESPEFDGVWVGEITAPNKSTPFGLGFTRFGEELFVSVYFPEMFLYGANFGSAKFRDGSFVLDALNLTLQREGESLQGTFAPGRLPVRLRKGGSFTSEPLPVEHPTPPPVAWSHSLGARIWASPVAHAGIIYVGTVDGKFHARRADTGAEVWTWTGANPLHGEALVTLENVFFVDDENDLVCLLRATGALQWRLPLHDAALAGGPVPKNETFNHRVATPIIDGRGMLYVGSTDGGLYAVRAKTGKKLWRHDAKGKIYAPVAARGDELIGATFAGEVFIFNQKTRRETARVKLGGPVVSAPLAYGNRIIVGARDYFLYGLDAAGAKPVWRNSYWFSWVESAARVADGVIYIGGSDYRRISALNLADGRALWATDVLGLSWGTPVVTRGTVYAGTLGQMLEGTVLQHRGGIVALDRATGNVRWRYTAPVAAGADFAGFAGSLVLADSKIIGAGTDGTLIAIAVENASN